MDLDELLQEYRDSEKLLSLTVVVDNLLASWLTYPSIPDWECPADPVQGCYGDADCTHTTTSSY